MGRCNRLRIKFEIGINQSFNVIADFIHCIIGIIVAIVGRVQFGRDKTSSDKSDVILEYIVSI